MTDSASFIAFLVLWTQEGEVLEVLDLPEEAFIRLISDDPPNYTQAATLYGIVEEWIDTSGRKVLEVLYDALHQEEVYPFDEIVSPVVVLYTDDLSTHVSTLTGRNDKNFTRLVVRAWAAIVPTRPSMQ